MSTKRGKTEVYIVKLARTTAANRTYMPEVGTAYDWFRTRLLCQNSLMLRGILAVGAGVAVAAITVGCGPATEISYGPQKHICNDVISRPNTVIGSGPFYVDATAGVPPIVVASARSSPIWVQVSPSCEHGAEVSVSDVAVITVSSSEVIKAKDGADVAVLVFPKTSGRATLTATVPGSDPHETTFKVNPPTAPPASSSP